MADIVDKKQSIIQTFDLYIQSHLTKQEFLEKIQEFSKDLEIVNIDLFKSIINEILQIFDELSVKELKQRKLMIESFLFD